MFGLRAAAILRRANVSRKGASWQHEDYDVFDGDRDVGRIYLVDSYDGNETWYWRVVPTDRPQELRARRDARQASPDNSCSRNGVEPTPCRYPAARANA
jgi:hypothetical protein